jgi:hypothetical protein
VDDEVKIRAFYETIRPMLEEMRHGCLVTLQAVDVLLYKPGKKKLFD